MPRVAKELSAIEVKRLKHPGGHSRPVTFAVGGVAGLLLQITTHGGRSWILRTRVGEKRREIGLGGSSVTLAQARERAREALESIRQGVDPVEARKANRAALVADQKRGITFADALDIYCSAKMSEFRSERHRQNWRRSLEIHAVPVIGDMIVSDIDRQDILRVLTPIWAEKTETAQRVRRRIEAVLSWARVNGHRTGDNPATWKGNLSEDLPAANRVAKPMNRPAVALDEAADWFADVQSRPGNAARALEFLALTAARSGEVRGATWDECDMKAEVWTVPGERMLKTGREHRVPLTQEAMRLLTEMPRIVESPYVFPAVRGGMLSDAAIGACMRRVNTARENGYLDARSKSPAVPHGLRSTFKYWATERTRYPNEMSEIAPSHKVGSEVERA